MKAINKTENRKWYLIDAEDKILGRVATQIAEILQGKNKPTYDPATDCGDFVIVINCEKIEVTGRKKEQKIYTWHSQYMGGVKKATFKELITKKPAEPIKKAVWGMLPKNKLRNRRILRLKIYSGTEHAQKAQNPIELKI